MNPIASPSVTMASISDGAIQMPNSASIVMIELQVSDRIPSLGDFRFRIHRQISHRCVEAEHGKLENALAMAWRIRCGVAGDDDILLATPLAAMLHCRSRCAALYEFDGIAQGDDGEHVGRSDADAELGLDRDDELHVRQRVPPSRGFRL